MSRTTRTCLRVALLAVTGAVAVFGAAGAASAHVGVSPDQASSGSFVRLSFQVPTESDTLSTTKVQVYLDTTHPIPTVWPAAVPGWTVSTTTTKLATPIKTDDGTTVTTAVSQITWVASSPDTAIKPGQFVEFPLFLGTLPEAVSRLEFKTLQTYSDGSVVRWIDDTPAGGPEPEHPAPLVKIVPGTPGGTGAPAAAAAATSSSGGSGGGSGTGGLVLGVIGVLLGLAGAVMGGLALARSRRPAVTTS